CARWKPMARVTSQREGRSIRYAIHDEHVHELLHWIGTGHQHSYLRRWISPWPRRCERTQLAVASINACSYSVRLPSARRTNPGRSHSVIAAIKESSVASCLAMMPEMASISSGDRKSVV